MRTTVLGAALLGSVAAACTEPQHGYVEIRLMPLANLRAYPLLLDDRPVAASQGGSVVIRHRVGAARLLVERRENERQTLCEFRVRKDRISTVTIGPATGGLRCTVEPG